MNHLPTPAGPRPRGTPPLDDTTTVDPSRRTALERSQARQLDTIACLLHQAAYAAWEIGDQAGLGSPMHDVGLGAYLACTNTVALIPAGHPISQPWLSPPAENEPAKLIASAEARLRDLPFAPGPIGLSDVILQVCDLAREARTVTPVDKHRGGGHGD